MLLVFYVWIWTNTCSHLLLAVRTPSRVSYKMLTMISVSIYLALPVFPLHLWNTVLLDIIFWTDVFLPTLWLCLFMTSMTSDEKSTVNHAPGPLYGASHFFSCFQIFLSLSFIIFTMMSLVVDLFVFILECVGFLGET